MLRWIVVVLLAFPGAVRAEAAARPSLLVMRVEPKQGVSDDVAELATNILTGELRRRADVSTVAFHEVEGAMGAEQQRMLAGCDTVSCAAEIAGALNTDQIVIGTLGRLGDLFLLSLSRIRRDATVLGSSVRQFPAGNEAAIAGEIPRAVQELFTMPSSVAAPVASAGAPQTIIIQQPPPPAPPEQPAERRILDAALRAGGGAGVLVGVVGLLGAGVAVATGGLLIGSYVEAFYIRGNNRDAVARVQNAQIGSGVLAVGLAAGAFAGFVGMMGLAMVATAVALN